MYMSSKVHKGDAHLSGRFTFRNADSKCDLVNCVLRESRVTWPYTIMKNVKLLVQGPPRDYRC